MRRFGRVAAVSIAVALSLLANGTAGADVLGTGAVQFPGKLALSIEPAGFQLGWKERTPTGYKAQIDFAGVVAPVDFGSVWLGAGMHFTYGTNRCYVVECGKDFGLWLFAMMTFENLIPLPLVPFVRVGVGGDVLFYDDIAGAPVGRVGAGLHYYFYRWLGVGGETNLAAGPGLYPKGIGTLLYGYWDFSVGVRFNF
jgi:hypothetical protein